MRWDSRLAVLFLVVFSPALFAQNLCPTGVKSDKLICLIPQVYGVNGLVLGPGPGHFESDFVSSSLKPLNSAIGRQAVLLPLASPSAGITLVWDPAAKIFTSSTDSFGPILTERAETIGKGRISLALAYQYFQFSDLDGESLKSLPVVFTQPNFTLPNSTTCSAAPGGFNTSSCGFIRDVIRADNRIDLKTHQFTTYISYGVTSRIDISAIIPIQNVRMAVTSQTTIVNNSGFPFHTFQRPDCAFPCRNQTFFSADNATGIGDISLRIKGVAWNGEHAALALGTDVRLPTGDSLNLLGAGAAGVKPFVVWSYRSRISSHIVAGYEVNGSSKTAGDISLGTKERLPGLFTYAGGADVWLTRRITVVADIVGQQVFQAQRISLSSFTELGPCPDVNCSNPPATGNVDPNLLQSTGSFNSTGVSLGGKVRPFSNVLITGNVLMKLNDGGLRAKAIPLVGVSYTF